MIVNDICLIYVSYAQQLQLSHLVFIYEKEVAFVPKSGKIVVKINWVTSSYGTGTPTVFLHWAGNMPTHRHTQIRNMSRKEKSKLKKGIDKIYYVECYWRNKDTVDRKVPV